MFGGAIVALITPFKGGEIDEDALRRLVNFQIENGTDAIVPCGTTGESPTLSHEEHHRVVDIVIDEVKGRIQVIAGSGSNSTKEAIDLTRHAKKAGADGVLMISPYYNKPTPEGLYQHFKAVSDAAPIPIIVYSCQSRTGSNIDPETMARLAGIDNVVGVKEASGDITQMARIIELCPDDFDVISGDDAMTLPLMALGGKGVISVASNVAPRLVSDMVSSFIEGDLLTSRELFFRLMPLFKALFLETNPIPVKMAAGFMGLIDPEMRLPLVPMGEENTARLKKALTDLGLL